jgi:hypothetical protein
MSLTVTKWEWFGPLRRALGSFATIPKDLVEKADHPLVVSHRWKRLDNFFFFYYYYYFFANVTMSRHTTTTVNFWGLMWQCHAALSRQEI